MTEPADPQPDPQSDPQPGERSAATEAWSTGDERVDDAVARLDQLDELDIDDHADVYTSIQDDVAAVLDEGVPASQGR